MIFKKGVKVKGIKPELNIGLIVADGVWKRYGKVLVVTSVVDSKHGEGSLHPTGYGGDLRTRYFNPILIEVVAEELRESLTDEYDVVIERNHIPLEYDAKD